MAKRATKKVAVKKTTRTKAAPAKSTLRKSTLAKSARRVVKPWTKDDVRALKAHSKARTPVAKISREMKRTVGALRRRAGILGIGLGERR
jgi:outer membrane PBP1 activator LpoA protein